MRETFICSACGEAHPIEVQTTVDDLSLCPACLELETLVCDHCGRRIMQENNAGDEHTPLCQSCYDRYYTNCIRCGNLLHLDDACYLDDDPDEEEPLCHSCYSVRHSEGGVQGYYYKPIPIFYGDGVRYLGVELEIDQGGERNSVANQLMDIANRCGRDHLYCKHDSSLEDGIELVTHPMTLSYHMDKMPWSEILSKAAELGYTSHQAHTCGLHVHVNRSAFGDTECEQENVIARILFFVENHWNELLRFSRRTRSQMEQWAARYGRKDDPKAVLDHAKDSSLGRYTCVNLTNDNTIEFRMFRGTLKLNTFLATLQMVDRICDVAFALTDQQMQDMTWTEFVTGCTAPELVQYLKERRLYVSEPVTAEVEV